MVQRLKMPFKGLSFVKTLVKFGIIYATDPLLQNLRLRSFASVDSPSVKKQKKSKKESYDDEKTRDQIIFEIKVL